LAKWSRFLASSGDPYNDTRQILFIEEDPRPQPSKGKGKGKAKEKQVEKERTKAAFEDSAKILVVSIFHRCSLKDRTKAAFEDKFV